MRKLKKRDTTPFLSSWFLGRRTAWAHGLRKKDTRYWERAINKLEERRKGEVGWQAPGEEGVGDEAEGRGEKGQMRGMEGVDLRRRERKKKNPSARWTSARGSPRARYEDEEVEREGERREEKER